MLVPVPSYPLFDHLTALDGVATIPYRLDYHGRWTLAPEDVARVWAENVRAVLAVSPNNPTGSTLAADELAALAAMCAERGAALIVDEVFADYSLGPESGSQRTSRRVPHLLARRVVEVRGPSATQTRVDSRRRAEARLSMKRCSVWK